MKLDSKKNRYKNLIIFISSVICVFHFCAVVYYLKEMGKSTLPIEGSIDSQLLLGHSAFLLLMIGYLIFSIFNNLVSRIISAGIGLLMMSLYYLWYHEKFNSLSAVTFGGEEYNWMVEQYGTFRGATTLDYWASFLTIILVLYSLFSLIYFLFYKHKANSYQ